MLLRLIYEKDPIHLDNTLYLLKIENERDVLIYENWFTFFFFFTESTIDIGVEFIKQLHADSVLTSDKLMEGIKQVNMFETCFCLDH